MRNKNEVMWDKVETLASKYLVAESAERELLFNELYSNLLNYVDSCATNSVLKAKSNGVTIPFEDFHSEYSAFVWKAIELYEKHDGKFTIRNLVFKRFGYVERIVWRRYSSKNLDGTTSYEKAKWGSTDMMFEGDGGESMVQQLEDMQVESIEKQFVEESENDIIVAFEAESPRYANVIRFMSLGYEGQDLAIATGESDKYDAKMRTLVKRSRQAFGKFMIERNPNLNLSIK